MTYPGQSFGDPGSAQRTATVTLNADVSGYANQMGAAADQTNQFSASVDKLQAKLGGLHSWAGHKLISFGERDFAVLGVATADAATFEKQLSTLSATAAVTGTSMRGIKGGIESAFTKFPVARGDIVALTEALTNMGVTGESQISSLTRTFLKLGAATGESTVGLAQGLTQLSRLMGTTDATQIGNMANSLLTVSKNAGVSASGVLSFSQAIAPMARQAGIGEGAVLGISTAFTKAGADGYVAANTFNSIIQDISQLVKTGSPEIAKYANLIGVTADQFKKMPGQQQVTAVLNAVGKGGPSATGFIQEQGYGVRAQSAIAAVTQSGDLQRQIDIATNSQGNQKNLNKAAGAAWNDLADKLAHVRDEFTQLGTAIGTTFLKPLEAGVTGVGMFASALNSMVKPFSAIIGMAGAGAGALGLVGGVAMNAAGIIGTVALGRMVTRGVHATATGGGFRVGRAGGATSQADQTIADRMRPGGPASRYERFAYDTGLGAARLLGPKTDRLAGLDPAQRTYHESFTDRSMARADRRLYYEGIQYGRSVRDPALATAQDQQRLTAETARLTPEQQSVYNAGSAYARLPVGGDLRKFSTWRNLGVAAPFRVVQALNAGQAQLLRESTRSAYDRLRFRDEQPRITMTERFDRMVAQTANKPVMDVVGQEANRTARGLGNLVGANVNAGAAQVGPLVGRLLRYGGPRLATSLIAGFSGVPLGGAIANQVRAGASPANVSEAARGFSDAGIRLGAAMRHPIAAFGELAKAGAATAVALKDLSIKAAGAGAGTLAGWGGSALRGGASLAWQGTKMAASAAFSLPGMVALSAGTYLNSKLKDLAAEQPKLGDYVNPIQKYNELLGTTTSNLANFNNALKDGTNAAGSGAKVTSFDQAYKVQPSDASNAPTTPTNKVFGYVAKAAGDNRAPTALAATLGTMQITDPQQLHAAVEDMLAAGIKSDTVQAALNLYKKGGGPDRSSGLNFGLGGGANLLGTVAAKGAGGSKSALGGLITSYGPSENTTAILGTAITGIDAQRISDASQVGGVYGQQKALQSYTKLLAPLLNPYQNGDQEQGVGALQELTQSAAQITGGSAKSFQKYLTSHIGQMKFKGANGQQSIIDFLGSTKEGKRYLSSLGPGGTTDPRQMDAVIAHLARTPDVTSFNSVLRRHGGALGGFAASNADVQYAIGAGQSSPGANNQAIQALLDKAVALGGGFEGATAQLSRFEGAIGDSSSALYKQALAAQQQAAQAATYRQPFQTRGQNFGQAVTGYQQASAAYYGTPKDQRTDDQYQFLQTQKQNYEAALGEAQQYQQSLYQTAQSYGIQMVRAEQDQGIQISRAKRNFRIQEDNAAFDFRRQQRRARDDFNRETRRAEADHATQLANQAATEAQSIYDPYARIQSKYVIDAGTLSQNLGDQNAALAKQKGELRKAKKMGLSEQAIQELNLADPNNAQQLDELVSNSLTPAMARKINAQEKTRVRDTQKLTQNPDNLAFQQSEREFHKQMARSSDDFHRTMEHAGQDYNTSVSRAEQQQAIAMGDMADDFGKTVKRAGEDLNTAMTEVTGNFGNMYDKTMAQIAASVQKFSPKAANQMRKDLKSLVQEFPFLNHGDASTYDPNAKIVRSPGVLGINPDGKMGSYDSKGKFHPAGATAPYLAGQAPHIAPPTQPKPTAGGSTTGSTGGSKKHLAEGGITVGPQLAWVSEWAPNAAEAHIPLNDRGATFMSDVISKALIQKMHTHGLGSMPSGSSSHYEIHEDHSTRFSGDMHIAAADLSDLLRQLQNKQRLSKLSSPSRR